MNDRPIVAKGECRPEEALARLEGLRDIYDDVVGKFLRDDDGFLRKLREAVEGGDVKEAVRAAHTLKGTAGMCGAVSAAEAAFAVERAAPTATREQLTALLQMLGAEIKAARAAFRKFGVPSA
jgi:two-component system, sensor histidine kinase and response regulator